MICVCPPELKNCIVYIYCSYFVFQKVLDCMIKGKWITEYFWCKFFLIFFYLFDLTECCGTTTAFETDSSGCLSFSFKTGTLAAIVRNEITYLCYIYDEIVTILPAAWNRSFTCTHSNGTFNLCVSDLRFSDSGLFSLKVSSILEQNVTLEIQGKAFCTSNLFQVQYGLQNLQQ